ncbi:MAG: hypothetical protein HY744_09030 [Deltaproteobacteria bacterium]|nr:hypothetical protein [Deltaproteobacteria bacterium]
MDNHKLALLALLCLAPSAVHCGGDEEEATLRCGDGTQEKDGACVALPALAPRECGQGTVYDEATNSCLPDYDVLCAEGMLFDEALNDCVPAKVDYPEAAEDNDPRAGGTPLGITLPEVGKTITVGGQIDAPTVIDDPSWGDKVWPDIDGVEFEAKAGQVLRLEGTSLGALPSVAFMVVPSDLYSETPTSLSPVRYGLAADGRNPVRYVRFLEDGTYWLLISDKDNLVGLESTGGADMKYVVALSSLAPPPDAVAPLGSEVVDNILDEPSFTKIDGAAPDMVVLLEVGQPKVFGMTIRHLFLLDENDAIVRRLSDTRAIELFSGKQVSLPMDSERMVLAQGTLKLFLDYEMWGGNDADYPLLVSEQKVTELGKIGKSSPAVAKKDEKLKTGKQGLNVYRFDVDAAEGAFIRLRIDDFDPGSKHRPIGVIRDSHYGLLGYVDPVGTGENEVELFIEGGKGYIEIFNGESGGGSYSYDFTLEFVEPVTNVVAEKEPNDKIGNAQVLSLSSLPVKVEAQLATTDLTDVYQVTPADDGEFTFYGYAPLCDVALTLYDKSGNGLDMGDDMFGSPWEETITHALTGGQTYYLEVRLWQAGEYPYALVVR